LLGQQTVGGKKTGAPELTTRDDRRGVTVKGKTKGIFVKKAEKPTDRRIGARGGRGREKEVEGKTGSLVQITRQRPVGQKSP